MEQIIDSSLENEKAKFLGRTYGWMALALLVSAGAAALGAYCLPVAQFIWSSFGTGKPVVFYGLCILEVALVLIFGARIRKLSVQGAISVFLAYSFINGLTLSSIFFIYEVSSIVYCFVASSMMFGAMSLFGLKTKKNLNTFGRYLMMALLGTLLVCLLNVIISSIVKAPLKIVDFVVDIAIVLIFTGLTAYDTQRILRAAENAYESDDFKKLAIYGALQLYLDFINIFLRILRFFGKRN